VDGLGTGLVLTNQDLAYAGLAIGPALDHFGGEFGIGQRNRGHQNGREADGKGAAMGWRLLVHWLFLQENLCLLRQVTQADISWPDSTQVAHRDHPGNSATTLAIVAVEPVLGFMIGPTR
jgi:hypothetical protein